jgi:hypothetical protein
MASTPICRSGHHPKGISVTDIIWLAVLGGLFLLTLAFVRLCERA